MSHCDQNKQVLHIFFWEFSFNFFCSAAKAVVQHLHKLYAAVSRGFYHSAGSKPQLI